ncbi:peptidylprolyl isomerase [Olleya aquimaris]|uniref:Parvulin-like peptidyl-prolyl cis-trans isomerase protein n=1 Tax=Olleya aquimaris TaxID=639310 RepID=A0A327RHV8_9FLAO|nr:peptidylprolyl isomerase [Olleya aquimaris]RAJ16201.1 parvulin-like peptidyl-prolyl cis-trans isomerase protein [Olleya aquimaris]
MKTLLKLTICLLTATTLAQTSIKKELDTITTVEQAEKLLETKKSRKNKVLIFNEEKHKTKLATALLNTNVGSIKTVKTEFNTTHYKVITKSDERHYRISYIYFDGNTLEASKIVDYKNDILKSYEDGIRFDDLAKRYSMDRNAKRGGDSGWLKEGSMPTEVEEQAFNLDNKLNTIYTVRIPETNSFYIILKTERIKTIKEIKVLKIVD